MKKVFLATAVLLTLCFAQAAFAQNPTSQSTPIKAVKNEVITITLNNTLANFVMDSSGNAAAQDLGMTTTWNVNPQRNSVTVCAGVSATLNGSLAANTDTIPASAVQATTGSTFAAINAGAGCGQASGVMVVSTNSVSDLTGRKSGSKTDTLHVKITGAPTNIEADTYSGTLTVYASAQ